MPKLDITSYSFSIGSEKRFLAAVMSDVHGEEYGYILDEVSKRSPDLIFIPGDIIGGHAETAGNGGKFLFDCQSIAPSYMSLGNHERMGAGDVADICRRSGVVLLDNSYSVVYGVAVGGLTSGYVRQTGRINKGHFKKTPPPDLGWLRSFAGLSIPKILLCHHPEYYPRYIKQLNIDLCLSGHAHGGQWRFFGIPVFAPDQTFFPKYAQGVHDGRLVVSRGLANNAPVPRIGNPRELVFIEINP